MRLRSWFRARAEERFSARVEASGRIRPISESFATWEQPMSRKVPISSLERAYEDGREQAYGETRTTTDAVPGVRPNSGSLYDIYEQWAWRCGVEDGRRELAGLRARLEPAPSFPQETP